MRPLPLGHRIELDGLRGVAVLAVVAFHAGVPVGRGGWLGVDIFFVLSGFLITTLLLEEHGERGQIALRAFYARRALRLLPALGVMLGVVAALVLAGLAERDSLQLLPWALAYIANWARLLGEPSGPLVHLWSLSVEEQFYVVAPLLLTAALRRRVRPGTLALTLAGVALAIAAARSLLYATEVITPIRAYFGSDLRADALLLGCALAAAREAGWATAIAPVARRLLAPAVLGLVVVFLAPASPFGGIGPLLFVPVDGAALVVVAAVVLAPERAGALRWEPLVRVGVLSYGLYLWHLPIMYFLGADAVERLVFGVPLALAAAVASRRLVEVPALRLKRRFDRSNAAVDSSPREDPQPLGAHTTSSAPS